MFKKIENQNSIYWNLRKDYEKVYFATLPNGYFGSAINSWNTLDVKRLAAPF